MKPVREWGPGDYRNAAIALAGLVVAIWLSYDAVRNAVLHPPEANPRLTRLEISVEELHAHEAHDDSLQLFNLCRESKTALETPERVAVAQCLERYPSLLEIWELRPELTAIQREAGVDTTP